MIWKVLAYFLKNIKILYITFILFCKVGLRDSKITDRVTVLLAASAAAKSFQSCPTLCEPRDGSPPGSPVARILQARTLEWVAISFSKAWMWKVKVKSLSHVPLFATPWTAAYQAPLSMGFVRQEYWSGARVSGNSTRVLGCHCLLCRVTVGPTKLDIIFDVVLVLP